MNITVTKKRTAGRISILVNGAKPSNELSRELTGADAAMFGIFCNLPGLEEGFKYGEYEKVFKFEPFTHDSPVKTIAENIKDRIFVVREWIKSLADYEDTAIVTIEDGASSSMTDVDRIRQLIDEVRSLVSASSVETAKKNLEGENNTERLTRKRRIVRK